MCGGYAFYLRDAPKFGERFSSRPDACQLDGTPIEPGVPVLCGTCGGSLDGTDIRLTYVVHAVPEAPQGDEDKPKLLVPGLAFAYGGDQ